MYFNAISSIIMIGPVVTCRSLCFPLRDHAFGPVHWRILSVEYVEYVEYMEYVEYAEYAEYGEYAGYVEYVGYYG